MCQCDKCFSSSSTIVTVPNPSPKLFLRQSQQDDAKKFRKMIRSCVLLKGSDLKLTCCEHKDMIFSFSLANGRNQAKYQEPIHVQSNSTSSQDIKREGNTNTDISAPCYHKQMSRDMTKPTKWVCAQQRLRSAWASALSDQSSHCAQWVAKDPRFLHADSEDSDQTGRMPRLIWVFAGRTLILLVLTCRGSNRTK